MQAKKNLPTEKGAYFPYYIFFGILRYEHIEGHIWEIRLKGRSGISRALYVTAMSRRVVIVRVFVKKTEKTPRREIDLALIRAKSVQ
jgi:phage-related protein